MTQTWQVGPDRKGTSSLLPCMHAGVLSQKAALETTWIMPADMYLGRREEQEAAELAALQHQDSIPRSAAPLSCTQA